MKTLGTRIGIILGILALIFGLTACGTSQESSTPSGSNTSEFTMIDVLGREVTLPQPPTRIVLAEGRGIFASGIITPDDPAKNIVAIGSDLQEKTSSYWEKLTQTHPDILELPQIGDLAKGDVLIETIISSEPDLLVMTADQYAAGQTTGFLNQLASSAIPYVVTDFRQHPLQNTTKSVEMYGQIFGNPLRAEEFNKDWDTTVNMVTDRVEHVQERPEVFIWRAAGLKECCTSFGKINLGEMVDAAGGTNLGDTLIEGDSGSLTPEKILAENPEIIIATGDTWRENMDVNTSVSHVILGYTSTPKQAEKSLSSLLNTPGFDQLTAPQEGKLFALWHQFYDTPFNHVALEQMALWIHPQLFSDLDPEQHFVELHKKYQPFDLSGVFFATHTPEKKS